MLDSHQNDGRYPGIDLDLRDYSGGSYDSTRPCYPIAVCPEAPGKISKVFQLREIFMLAVMDKLTDKPGWHTKVFDDAIVARWRVEALQQPEDGLYRLATEDDEQRYGRYAMPSKLSQPRCRILSEKAFNYISMIFP